jgi:hypothetical protein
MTCLLFAAESWNATKAEYREFLIVVVGFEDSADHVDSRFVEIVWACVVEAFRI